MSINGSQGKPQLMNVADVRRRPRQERSKTRVETILEVALEMVVAHGAEAFTMRELARRAGVQIGSIYQYFPSKSAVLRELATRNLERVRALLQGQVDGLMADFDGHPPVPEAVHRVVDAYFAHYRDQPAAVAVWAGAQADHALRELDVEDTRRTAEFLVPSLMRILGSDDADDLHALALLVAELTGSAARLALSVEPPLRDRLIAHHKQLLIAALEGRRRP